MADWDDGWRSRILAFLGSMATQSASSVAITGGTISGVTVSSSNLITRATVQNATGTAIDFTGIPATAKMIMVSLRGVSLDGNTDELVLQIGDSGGIEDTSYLSNAHVTFTGANNAAGAAYTNGFGIWMGVSRSVTGVYTLVNHTGNVWTGSFTGVDTAEAGTIILGAGEKELSGTLDRVRLTRSGSTDSFDTGSVNIFYM